jgi:hypothetical protein
MVCAARKIRMRNCPKEPALVLKVAKAAGKQMWNWMEKGRNVLVALGAVEARPIKIGGAYSGLASEVPE